MRYRVIFASVVALAIGLFSFNLAAQVIPRSIQEGGTDAALREKKNAWTVGIVGGLLSGTYMRFVDEMASVLNDGDNLRILPIVSYGAASNLDDLLYLRGVDAAVTQSDVFEYFRTQRKTPNLERRVQYVIRMPISELHILARNDVQSLEDLRGKKVNFGPAGTGEPYRHHRVSAARDQCRTGDDRSTDGIAEIAIRPSRRHCAGDPQADRFLRQDPGKFRPASGEYPLHQDLRGPVYAWRVHQQDYPNLLQGQDRIDTIAVPAVLAVFNWQKNSDRYNRVERFIQYLFSRWDTFQHPPYHPKWRDVNLAATVPGWTRFSVAEQLLQQMQVEQQQKQQQRAAFETFLSNQPKMPVSDADREDLFRKFLQWQAREHR